MLPTLQVDNVDKHQKSIVKKRISSNGCKALIFSASSQTRAYWRLGGFCMLKTLIGGTAPIERNTVHKVLNLKKMDIVNTLSLNG